VETFKSVTSRRLKEKFPHYLTQVYWDGGMWARELFVSTVELNEATIRHYVQHQDEEETGQAQLEL
jgi:putative transposase